MAQVAARRLALDPDAIARGQRIDAATLDLEDAAGERDKALAAVEAAEAVMSEALGRMFGEGMKLPEVTRLSGLSEAVVRRLKPATSSSSTNSAAAGAEG